ncbi:MAG: hypothetical protein HYX75_20645 [Acidobacteria bacterium]|nr:hypothetical protein [Acidobacteriota bacterium]
MSDEAKPAGVISEIRENLAGVFRHILPGVIVVGAAHVAHPTWFVELDAKSWQHLTIVAVVALAVGNAWFALNRHGVQQIVDYVAYLLKNPPTAITRRGHYLATVAGHVTMSVMTRRMPDLARTHVAFRASSVFLLYTIAEVGLLFSLWPESGTVFAMNTWRIRAASGLVLVMAMWQSVITRRIDYEIVEASQQKPPNNALEPTART